MKEINPVPRNPIIQKNYKETHNIPYEDRTFANLLSKENEGSTDFGLDGKRKIKTSHNIPVKKPTEVWLG